MASDSTSRNDRDFVEPFERLEGRRLLSSSPMVDRLASDRVVDRAAQEILLPVVTPDPARNTNAADVALERAWTSASNLAQYDAAVLKTVSSWVVRSTSSVRQLQRALPGATIQRSGLLDDAFYVDFQNPAGAVGRLGRAGAVSSFYPLIQKQRTTRFIPNDALFGQQQHLRNTGQSGGLVGSDANITGAWDITLGQGVVIGIVDDGVQYTHPDISPNYRTDLDRDVIYNDNAPLPSSNDPHGTSVAGVAAARGNNGIGVSGAAPQAQLAGLRIFDGLSAVNDAGEATAFTWNNNDIDIYNNSWGPPDFPHLEGPDPLAMAALAATATNGRNGLGGIITWAGGNGGTSDDNSNYDGYANSRHTIAVGALDNFGQRASYSEPGANLLVVAPSDGGSRGIYTTDLLGSSGYSNGDYANDFGGTSSATPLASGVIALMLSANPNLTYRDVQHILVQTAETVDASDPSWQTNGAGHTVSEQYGHGNIDALAAVQAAQTWTNVGPEQSYTTGNLVVNQTIPDNNAAGITAQVNVAAGLNVEHVEVYFDASHSWTGDLEIILTSPSGTQSVLQRSAFNPDDYTDWTYTSTLHWGEESDGVWRLNVRDRVSGDVGTFQRWSLNLFGTTQAAPAPELVAKNFNRQQAAQSIFTFDGAVDASNASYVLQNLTTGQTIPAANLQLVANGPTVTVTYVSNGVARPMPNGNYIGTLSGVASTGTGGAVADPQTLSFFFLNGDLDGDRDVDLFDAALLERNFGRTDNPTYGQGDIDYDGDVDLFDAALLERNFGTTLAAAPSIVTGAAPRFGGLFAPRTVGLFAGSSRSGSLINGLL